MSAQETTPGHWASSWVLAPSMISSPRRPWCLLLSTSALPPPPLMRTDPSHPRTKQSWNWRRRSAGRMVGSAEPACRTTEATVDSAPGQELE